jgi:hypothetical protein
MSYAEDSLASPSTGICLMKKRRSRTVGKADAFGRNIAAALNQAAMDAVEAHKKAGQPLVVWQDGRPTLISPDNVLPAKNGGRTPRGRKNST